MMTHTGPEADSSKAFVNDMQIQLAEDTIYCIQKLQGLMQGGGFERSTPLLEDFLSDVEENEEAVIKSIHVDKVIEDFAGYNTVFKEVYPEVKNILDAVEETVKDCDVVSRKKYTLPAHEAADTSFDDFTNTDKATGFVPGFRDKFNAFHEEHSDDISGSSFKTLLETIVGNLNAIIDGMQKGTFDISRYNDTRILRLK